MLLVADCMTVDPCLLARSIAQYSSTAISAAQVKRQFVPAIVPCDPTCSPATAGEALYSAVQHLLPLLAQRLKAGDEGAWAVGFGLRHFVDGGLLEDLDTTLAGAIKAQPRPFLRAARQAADPTAVGVVIFLGEPFIDVDMARRCQAHRERLASIATVADEDLRDIRNAATRALATALESCK